MFDTSEKRREISKWFIGIFTCCILIYLGFRHISSIASAISWLIDLARPLLIGAILALFFNLWFLTTPDFICLILSLAKSSVSFE